MCKFSPLNAELNPICHLLALLGAHHILHVSRIRVKPRSMTKDIRPRADIIVCRLARAGRTVTDHRSNGQAMIIFSVRLHAPLFGGDRNFTSSKLNVHYKHDKIQINFVFKRSLFKPCVGKIVQNCTKCTFRVYFNSPSTYE